MTMLVLNCPHCRRCLAEVSATAGAMVYKLPCKSCRRWVLIKMPPVDSRPSLAQSLA